MPNPKGGTLARVAEAVAAEIDAAIPLDEFLQRVVARYETKSKNPARLVRTNLRYELPRLGIVFLDPKTIIPLRVALQGVRFRVLLDAEQLKHGVLWDDDWFAPFAKPNYSYQPKPEPLAFFDANGQPIPTRSATLKIKAPRGEASEVLAAMLGELTNQRAAIDLGGWLRAQKARRGDSVLVTVRDWEHAQFTLELEPRAHRRQAEIQAQNRALADMLWNVLQETSDEKLILNSGIATAYARLPSARDYPGDHWHLVLEEDPRMREEIAMIVPADHKSWLDLAMDEDDAIEEQPFTKEQGKKAYRFSARAKNGKRVCTIEILGKNTLADFDGLMREAFDLDTIDHLSEFTRIVRRGKSKRPHKSPYGEINPFEPTPAMEVRLAGLGLEVGAELEYVYDFGDWLEHQLILESIAEPERGVEYPRVIEEASRRKRPERE